MKAITHNILMCNTKKCSGTDKNYPLIIKPINIKENQVEFDEELTKIWFDRQDKRALNEFCKDLNIVKYEFTKVDDNIKIKMNFGNMFIKLLMKLL